MPVHTPDEDGGAGGTVDLIRSAAMASKDNDDDFSRVTEQKGESKKGQGEDGEGLPWNADGLGTRLFGFSAAFVVPGEFAKEGFEVLVDESAGGLVGIFGVDVEGYPADAVDEDFRPCVGLVAHDEDGGICAAHAVVEGVPDGDAGGDAL